MATYKADVIGQLEVGGVAPGGTVELDDEHVNLRALVQAKLISEPELVPDVDPSKLNKAQLLEHAAKLGVDLGEAKTKDEILAAVLGSED